MDDRGQGQLDRADVEDLDELGRLQRATDLLNAAGLGQEARILDATLRRRAELARRAARAGERSRAPGPAGS